MWWLNVVCVGSAVVAFLSVDALLDFGFGLIVAIVTLVAAYVVGAGYAESRGWFDLHETNLPGIRETIRKRSANLKDSSNRFEMNK